MARWLRALWWFFLAVMQLGMMSFLVAAGSMDPAAWVGFGLGTTLLAIAAEHPAGKRVTVGRLFPYRVWKSRVLPAAILSLFLLGFLGWVVFYYPWREATWLITGLYFIAGLMLPTVATIYVGMCGLGINFAMRREEYEVREQ